MFALLAASAFAADLTVTMTTPYGGSAHVILPDADTKAPPAITVPNGDASMRFAFTLVRDGETWRVSTAVDAVKAGKRGREKVSMVARPVMVFHTDEPASFEMGASVPIAGTEPLQVEERMLRVAFLVTEPIPG